MLLMASHRYCLAVKGLASDRFAFISEGAWDQYRFFLKFNLLLSPAFAMYPPKKGSDSFGNC